MRSRSLFGAMLAASLCCAAPAGAVPAPAPVRAAEATSLNAAQAAYGHWLAELLRIAQPVQGAMSEVGNRAVAMAHAPNVFQAAAELRPRVVELVALAEATDARLARLDAPDFPMLQLPPELRAAAIKAAVRQLNRSIHDAYQNYLPVLDAIARHDLAAARSGAARSMVSMQDLVSSQLLLVRAQQAVLPRSSSAWHAANVQILFLRAIRLYAGAMTGSSESSAGLANGLRTIGDELDATAGQGGAAGEAELAQSRAVLADAQRQGNVGAAAVAGRGITVITESSALFPLARELATLLRGQASRLPARPSAAELLAAIGETYPIRDRLVAIISAMGSRLSDAQ